MTPLERSREIVSRAGRRSIAAGQRTQHRCILVQALAEHIWPSEPPPDSKPDSKNVPTSHDTLQTLADRIGTFCGLCLIFLG
ncbi:MAG: hypothetical protein CMJ85_10445 [Planctomycetes bacterium]|nr:hypothetical protein [Planctomycetota bacterium]